MVYVIYITQLKSQLETLLVDYSNRNSFDGTITFHLSVLQFRHEDLESSHDSNRDDRAVCLHFKIPVDYILDISVDDDVDHHGGGGGGKYYELQPMPTNDSKSKNKSKQHHSIPMIQNETRYLVDNDLQHTYYRRNKIPSL